jgi:hypothetical protein
LQFSFCDDHDERNLLRFQILRAGLLRCGKSCRLRWTNYLRPDLKRGLLSDAEEKLVIDLHAQLGNRYGATYRDILLSLFLLKAQNENENELKSKNCSQKKT